MALNNHRDSIASVLEFLERINMKNSARTLERESGLFFNLGYFEDCFIRGSFEAAEDYLKGFTKVHDNIFSINVVFEIRWHKFLAALSANQRAEARVIIREDFTPLGVYNELLVGFVTDLANMHNFRMHEAFQNYGDPEYHRRERVGFIRLNLESNPLLFGKIKYPTGNVVNNNVVLLQSALQFPTAAAAPPLPAASLMSIPPPPPPPPHGGAPSRALAFPGQRNVTVTPSRYHRSY